MGVRIDKTAEEWGVQKPVVDGVWLQYVVLCKMLLVVKKEEHWNKLSYLANFHKFMRASQRSIKGLFLELRCCDLGRLLFVL